MSHPRLIPISALICAAAFAQAQTAAPAPLTLAVSGVDSEGRCTVSLVFHDALDSFGPEAFGKTALRRLRVTAADGTARPFTVPCADRAHDIAVAVKPGDTELRLTFAAEGDSPARSGRFAVPPMFVARADTEAVTPGAAPVFAAEIRFTQKLNPRQTPPRVTSTPAIPGLLTHIEDHRLVLTGALPTRTTVRVKLESDLLAEDGWVIRAGESFPVTIGGREPGAAFAFTSGILSPKGSLAIPMTACNIAAVRLHTARLSPDNLVAALHEQRMRDTLAETSAERVVPLKTAPDEVRHLLCDLRPSLPGRPGVPDERASALGVHLLRLDWETGDDRYRWRPRDEAFVTVTDIALTPSLDHDGRTLTVWSTGLSTGKPLPGVAIEVRTAQNRVVARGVTDASGLVALAVPGDHDGTRAWVVTGALGDDFSYVKLKDKPVTDDGAGRREPPRGLDIMLYGERGLWRGGETVRLTGIVRTASGADAPESPLEVRLRRYDGTVVARRIVTPARAESGFFHVGFPLAADVPYGVYTAEVSLPGSERTLGKLPVTLAPFEPLRLRTALTADPAPALRQVSGEKLPLRAGGTPVYTLTSLYRFGAPAAGLDAHARFHLSPAILTLPAFPDFTFGHENDAASRRQRTPVAPLDAGGRRAVSPDKTPPPGLWRLDTLGVVTEPGGRTDTASASELWCTAAILPGIAVPDAPTAGRATEVRIALADAAGKPATAHAPVTVTVARVLENWTLQEEDGRRLWRRTEERAPAGAHTLSADRFVSGVASCAFTLAAPGRHEIVATLPDGATSLRSVWVAGADTPEPGAAPHKLDLRCLAETARPGDTVTVAVKAPFTGAALLTLESDRVLESRVVEIGSRTTQVSVAIPAQTRGSVRVRLRLVRPLEAKHPSWKPVDATGELMIPLEHGRSRIDCAVVAPGAGRPGAAADITVNCANAGGKPVAVHCWAVDTGMLDLTRFASPDPFAHFFAPRRAAIAHASAYDEVLPDFARTLERIGAGDGAAAYRGAGIRHRKPIAVVWHTVANTDASGRLTLKTQLPDHTGSLRWMAVAAQGDRYGAASAETALARPVQIETSAPAFLAPGDTLEVPVTLINTTGKPLTVSLATVLSASLTPVGALPGPVTLPAGREPWRGVVTVRAGNDAGPATVKLTATGAFEGGAASETLICTIRHATPPESRVTSRTLAPGDTLAVVSDREHFVGEHARFLIHATGDAVRRLATQCVPAAAYPHGCLEQTASRILALTALADLDPAAGDQTRARLRTSLDRFALLRRADGGLAYWPDAEKSDPAGSLRAAESLLAVKRPGIEPDPELARGLADYLRVRLYATDTGADTQARLCATLAGFGVVERNRLNYLTENADTLDNAGLAALAIAHARAGDPATGTALLTARLPKLAPAPALTRGDAWWQSSAEADALVLTALVTLLPRHPATLAYANALADLAERETLNTLEQSAIVAAVAAHGAAAADKAPAPPSVTLAGGPAPVVSAQGLLWRDLPESPAPTLKNTGPAPVVLSVMETGVARRATVEDRTLRVRRTLLDAATGAPLDPGAPPRVGAAVRVRLTLDVLGDKTGDLPDIAITDLLPAGLEPDGTRVTTRINGAKVSHWDNPVTRTEVRDDRVLVFLTAKRGLSFEYLARAVAAGKFTLPPPLAQSMYRPDLRSVGESGELVIRR